MFGTTGSVAAIKTKSILEKLYATGMYDVILVPTKSSLHFYKIEEMKELFPDLVVKLDEDEWNNWKKIGDPVEHIDLRKWADIMLIAPLDANTLAKMANGLSDNLLVHTIILFI